MPAKRKSWFPTVIEARGDEPSIIISTSTIDREGDVLVPEGARLENYLKNPVVLFGHDHHELPVGAATSITIEPGRGLRASWRWLEGDERAGRVRNAWDQRALGATSVGFSPIRYEPREDDGYGLRYTEWELLEFSIVNVPANPEAVRVLRGLGLLSGAAGGRKATALGTRDEARLRRALSAIEEILAGAGADAAEAAREAIVEDVLHLDDEHLQLDDATIRATVESVLRELIQEQVTRHTGRLP